MKTKAAALSGEALVKRYSAVLAVDSVDIELKAGEIVGLLGPNGAGKSSVFRLLAGLEQPNSGRVCLEGEEVTTWPMYRRVRAGLSYLPQGPSLFRDLSVGENLTIASGRDIRSFDKEIAEFGFLDCVGQVAKTLSGGMRRRLEILRCIVQKPKYLLLDEPFSGVEPMQIEFLKHQIRSLRVQGVGVLLTDHAVRDVLPLCDRAVIIDRGIVQCAGSPEYVAEEPNVRSRYFGEGFRI